MQHKLWGSNLEIRDSIGLKFSACNLTLFPGFLAYLATQSDTPIDTDRRPWRDIGSINIIIVNCFMKAYGSLGIITPWSHKIKGFY